jgi:hypothetical protein
MTVFWLTITSWGSSSLRRTSKPPGNGGFPLKAEDPARISSLSHNEISGTEGNSVPVTEKEVKNAREKLERLLWGEWPIFVAIEREMSKYRLQTVFRCIGLKFCALRFSILQLLTQLYKRGMVYKT